MSVCVNKTDKLVVLQDQVGLVVENMNRIATLLEESYGVKAIPMIDSVHDDCHLVVQPTGKPVGMSYHYDKIDILEFDAEKEAQQLAEFLVSRFINTCQG